MPLLMAEPEKKNGENTHTHKTPIKEQQKSFSWKKSQWIVAKRKKKKKCTKCMLVIGDRTDIDFNFLCSVVIDFITDYQPFEGWVV